MMQFDATCPGREFLRPEMALEGIRQAQRRKVMVVCQSERLRMQRSRDRFRGGLGRPFFLL